MIFGGKAAPGLPDGEADHQADQRRRGGRQQRTRAVSPLLKVVFLPDFNVKTGQHVYPAADLSEQISTAGKEASGTGNMKFAMNGALTIGTLDGANVEIRDAVGTENFFLFGLTADRGRAGESGWLLAARILRVERRAARDASTSSTAGVFTNGDRELFRPLVESLLTRDDYMLLADYQAYVDCQQRVSDAYRDRTDWTRMSILNCRAGRPILVGSVDPRLLPRHLARQPAAARRRRLIDDGVRRRCERQSHRRERAARRVGAAPAASTSACSRSAPR